MSNDDYSNETSGLLKDEGLTELHLDDETVDLNDSIPESKNETDNNEIGGPRSYVLLSRFMFIYI